MCGNISERKMSNFLSFFGSLDFIQKRKEIMFIVNTDESINWTVHSICTMRYTFWEVVLIVLSIALLTYSLQDKEREVE